MPEPNFKVGQNVRLGVDTFESIPKQMVGKIVQIDRVHPFHEVNGAFFCDVHAMDRNIRTRPCCSARVSIRRSSRSVSGTPASVSRSMSTATSLKASTMLRPSDSRRAWTCRSEANWWS